MTSHSRGGYLADLGGDSSFMVLSINHCICAESPAVLLHPHSWAWIRALVARSRCVHVIAWLPTPVPKWEGGLVAAQRGGKTIS